MIEVIVAIEFYVLMALPFVVLPAATFIAWVGLRAVRPPPLMVALVVSALVTFVCSGYIAALTFNARLLGNVNPPGLLPVTLLALIAPLSMIPVIAFVLWRSQNGNGEVNGS